MSALSDISKVITPGGRVGDDSSLDRSPGKNWVEDAGGLPQYIKEVAHAFLKKGMDMSKAISMAVGVIRNWAEGKGNVTPKVRAAAVACMAEWDAKRAGAHVAKGKLDRLWSDHDFVDFIVKSGTTIVEKCGPDNPDCNCPPEKKKRAAQKAKRHVHKHGGKCTVCEYRKKKKTRKVVSKQGFKTSEIRGYHGRWVVPGQQGVNRKIVVRRTSDGKWGVFVGQETKPREEFSNKSSAIAYANGVKTTDVQNDRAQHAKAASAAGNKKTKGGSASTASGSKQKSSSSSKPSSSKGSTPKSSGTGSKASTSSGTKAGTQTGTRTGTTSSTTGRTVTIPQSTRIKTLQENTIKRLVSSGVLESRAQGLVSGKLGPYPQEAALMTVYNDRLKKIKATTKVIKKREFKKLVKELDAEINADVTFEAVGKIEKVNSEKQLVFGWASVAKHKDGTVEVDKQGDVLEDIDQMEKVAYDFVLHSRDGGEMHVRKGVSTMVESFVSTPEKWEAMGIPAGTLPVGWWVGYKVLDQEVWKGVKSGKYKMFSVHGTGMRKVLED